MRKAMLGLAVPVVLLAACRAKVGKEYAGNDSASSSIGEGGNVAVHASDRAQGVSVSLSGIEAKVKLPGAQLGGGEMDIGGMELYPGSELHGVDVTDRKGSGDGVINMRFTSSDAPDKLAAYYAAAARDKHFTAIHLTNIGGKATLAAKTTDGDELTIGMESGPGGTTTGRIVIKDGPE